MFISNNSLKLTLSYEKMAFRSGTNYFFAVNMFYNYFQAIHLPFPNNLLVTVVSISSLTKENVRYLKVQ